MWTYEDFEGLMANVTVRRKYLDGEHVMTQLLAHEDYCLHQIDDEGYTDEHTGNYYPPTYSYQVTTSASSEAETIAIYEALLIQPGMEIVGVPKEEEIM